MPWLGIYELPITLAQATALTASDITISSDIGVNYGPVTVTGSGTSYTITLAQPIKKADRVTITIARRHRDINPSARRTAGRFQR